MKLDMIWIPGGTFEMGSNDGEANEKPVHTVELDGFWMGKFEVTQAQYEAIIGKNPSKFKGSKNPVDWVSWNDATEFCRELSAKTSQTLTLPTEAQWEYACRAGSKGKYCFGDDMSQFGDFAWYDQNSDDKKHPVGGKKPNSWGLYDMHGNVGEWCQDWYDGEYYSKSPTRNPQKSHPVEYRVLRGGSWASNPSGCRSASRGRGIPDDPLAPAAGFRIVRTQK